MLIKCVSASSCLIVNFCLHQVLLFLPDKISEHSYQAVGSKSCEKSARRNANLVRNKCNEAIQKAGLHEISYGYINWMEEVETSKEYEMALNSVKNLYQVDDEFYADIRDSTEAALRCLRSGREKGGGNSKASDNEAMLDLEEGVKYPLKELAFLAAVPSIYEDCEEFVLVYHRPWPVLEKFFDGGYDGIARPYLGFLVLT